MASCNCASNCVNPIASNCVAAARQLDDIAVQSGLRSPRNRDTGSNETLGSSANPVESAIVLTCKIAFPNNGGMKTSPINTVLTTKTAERPLAERVGCGASTHI